MGYILIFTIAIILWLAISVIIVMTYQTKREKNKQVIEQGKKEQAPTYDGYKQLTSEGKVSGLLNSPKESGTWKEQLEQFPGISGWVVIRNNGDVIDISDSQYESAGVSLAQMVEWLGQHVNELDVHQPRSLELETKHGSILILFPRNQHLDTNLILFLDKESYWNQIRDNLSEIDWDINREGVL